MRSKFSFVRVNPGQIIFKQGDRADALYLVRLGHIRVGIEQSGREVQPLPWFEALALWKAAVFCEAIYGRFIRGELGAEDTRAAIFEHAVPLLAQTALDAVS